MSPETHQAEYPYSVRIETSTGPVVNVSLAFLTRKQIEDFLQFDFKRLVQEAGVKGARIHVDRAMAADYDKVLQDVAAYLRGATARTA